MTDSVSRGAGATPPVGEGSSTMEPRISDRHGDRFHGYDEAVRAIAAMLRGFGLNEGHDTDTIAVLLDDLGAAMRATWKAADG